MDDVKRLLKIYLLLVIAGVFTCIDIVAGSVWFAMMRTIPFHLTTSTIAGAVICIVIEIANNIIAIITVVHLYSFLDDLDLL